MNRKILILAALMAAFISFPSFAAQNVPNATDSYKAASYTIIPTVQPESLAGHPPVGYMDKTTGKYKPVTTDDPLPVISTYSMVMPPNTFPVSLSAGVACPIGSVASWTAGSYAIIRATTARTFIAKTGVSTSTAILGGYIESGEQLGIIVGSSTAGTWGTTYLITTAAASAAILVFPPTR